jgi:hypothetical protein
LPLCDPFGRVWRKAETPKEALVAADGDLELAVLLAQGIDAETAKTLIRRKP